MVQPNLAYSELEEPELELLPPPELLEALEALDEVELAELAELDSEEEELLAAPPEEELYKSEYQPPPLRMNPPLREIWRWASGFPQEGQSLSGLAVIDC